MTPSAEQFVLVTVPATGLTIFCASDNVMTSVAACASIEFIRVAGADAGGAVFAIPSGTLEGTRRAPTATPVARTTTPASDTNEVDDALTATWRVRAGRWCS
ncbi:hypothetical protein GCM10023068_14620 [Leifsonia shinshuensis]